MHKCSSDMERRLSPLRALWLLLAALLLSAFSVRGLPVDNDADSDGDDWDWDDGYWYDADDDDPLTAQDSNPVQERYR